MNGRFLSIATVVLFAGPLTLRAFDPIYERAPIYYHETEPDTKLTRFFQTAGNNPVLCNGSPREVLAELLEKLKVPVESQVLVFSKTSAQNSRIAPETPRAIYFSDDLYLGWVQGGEIEAASFDARLGMVFHLIKLTERRPGSPPPLARERSCLNCHAGSSNHDLPGLMVRSVYPTATGLPLFEAGTFHTRQSSPVEERWGGWYVTGSVEGREHLGNALAQAAPGGPGVELQRLAEGRVLKLDELFGCSPYLNGGQSDVVALMTLEHQVGVHNVLIEANLATQATLHRHVEMKKAFGEPVDSLLSETNERILQRLATRVLKEMLYVEEVQLPGGIEGTGVFQAAFEEGRKKSAEGRSLRDFRLYERLMKYRCSHLIYSEAFNNLPEAIRSRILQQLHGILTRPADWPEFSHLGEAERGHILAIVRETVPDLPEGW
ncbi:MAG: hypothetical protein KDN18_19725 [Verrucomicrobiae bacterium]|nr:hypothetical protein [Verrucomicrobiae bacterium]